MVCIPKQISMRQGETNASDCATHPKFASYSVPASHIHLLDCIALLLRHGAESCTLTISTCSNDIGCLGRGRHWGLLSIQPSPLGSGRIFAAWCLVVLPNRIPSITCNLNRQIESWADFCLPKISYIPGFYKTMCPSGES